MSESLPPPIPISAPEAPASAAASATLSGGWDYPSLARTWWLAAIALLALPPWIMQSAFTPAPPAPGEFRLSMLMGIGFTSLFLLVSLILFTRWREQLPPVTRPRWYGPAEPLARRRGFWILWALASMHATFWFGLMGPQALGEVLINAPAAYLRPDLSGFGIEIVPADQSGLLHLRLINTGKFAIPVHAEQQLGMLQISSRTGPYLLGLSEVRIPVHLTTELTGLSPLPEEIASGESITFLLPLPRWAVILDNAPRSLPIDILYFPIGSLLLPSDYAPLDLHHGTLQDIPVQ